MSGAQHAAGLTARQLEVAALLRRGYRHAEIAAILDITPRQVARHAADARARSGAATSGHLLALLAGAPQPQHVTR